MRYIIQITLCFLLFSACHSSTSVGEKQATNSPDKVLTQDPFYCDDIVAEEELEENVEYIRTTITSYQLVEKCLCLEYQYSGCRETERLMVWDGSYNESNRPEVQLHLLTEAAGLCEMLLTDSACFSMKKTQLVGNQVLVRVNDQETQVMVDFSDSPPAE